MALDYRINPQNPFMSALQGFQIGQQIQAQQAQMQAQQQAQQRQAMMQQDLADFAAREGKTPEDYQRLMTKYPEIGQQIQQDLNQYNENVRQNKINQLLPVYAALSTNNVDQAKELLDEYQSAAENSGDAQQAKQLGLLKDQIDIDPQGALTSSELYLYSAIGPEKLLELQKSKIAKPEEFVTAGGQIVFRDPGTQKEYLATGKLNKRTGKFEIASEQIPGEILSRLGETTAEQQARVVRTTGQQQAVKEAITTGAKYSQQADEIGKNILAYNDAINIIEEGLSKNANLGLGWVRSRLPKLDPYAIRFQQAARELGLGVVSRVTFGALSEKELELAMATAVPSTLGPKQALQWLKDKREAQQKLKDEMDRAAAFIGSQNPDGTFNTVSDWKKLQLEEKKRSQAGTGDVLMVQPGEMTATSSDGTRKLVWRDNQWLDIKTGKPVEQ